MGLLASGESPSQHTFCLNTIVIFRSVFYASNPTIHREAVGICLQVPLLALLPLSCHSDNPVQLACLTQQVRANDPGTSLSALQAVHTLEDVGDSELPALAGGEVLRTIKIINKEVRAASRVAKTGMERLRDALTTVSSVHCQYNHIHNCLACSLCK